MPLSNAERQKRYRDRIKVQGRDSRFISSLREAFEMYKRDFEEAASAQGDKIDYTPAAFVIDMFEQPQMGFEVLRPILRAAFDIPDDPWPGLTGDDLVRMTKGRTKEAKAKGLRTYPGQHELDWGDKFIAWTYREWLTGGASPR